MYLYLGGDQHYRIENIADAAKFVRALPLLLDKDDHLVFSSYGSPSEISDFLAAHQLPPDEFVSGERERLSAYLDEYPQSFAVLFPCEPALLDRLGELITPTTDGIDLCHHVHGYGPRGSLFCFHDPFVDPLHISTRIPQERVEAFCRATGGVFSIRDGPV